MLPAGLGRSLAVLIHSGEMSAPLNVDKTHESKAGTEQVEELDDLNLFR